VIQVEEIGSQLESIAHPSTHHHHSISPHRHHHDLFFPIWIPPAHKQKVDPHFHDMTLKWEKLRDGMTRMFAEMKVRLAKKVKDKKDEEDAKAKAKKEKDDAVEAEKKKTEALQKKLDAEDKHKEKLLEEHEE
jgi:hypothetical protein